MTTMGRQGSDSHLTAMGRQGSEVIVGAIARDRRRVVTDLVVLTKPRVVLMVLVTTLVGYYVALPGAADWARVLHLAVGTMLAGLDLSPLQPNAKDRASPTSAVERRDRLGRLLHEYYRAAA